MEMFSSQYSKNSSCSLDTRSDFALVSFLLKELNEKRFSVVEIVFEVRTEALYDLTNLSTKILLWI